MKIKVKLTKVDIQDLNTPTEKENLEIQKKFNDVLEEELSKPENRCLLKSFKIIKNSKQK